MRLTEEQLNNPLLVLDDFFECYHLNETREILWQWLTAVLSSAGSISNEPLERSNQIYFYEKIEELIEAGFILKSNQPAIELNDKSREDVVSAPPIQIKETGAIDEKMEKSLVEYANEDPLYVIQKVLDPYRSCFISTALKEWLDIGLSCDHGAYDDPENRQKLIVFNDHLLLLVEAVLIYSLPGFETATKEQLKKTYTIHLLSKDQIAKPEQVIIEFFEKYTSRCIMRELEDWLEAGIGYTGSWRNEITSPWYVLQTYKDIICLIKSAEQLLTRL